jgi:hypothetical protein
MKNKIVIQHEHSANFLSPYKTPVLSSVAGLIVILVLIQLFKSFRWNSDLENGL